MDIGPLYVAFAVSSDFPFYKSGVFQHTTSKILGVHDAVTLVGYGVVNGVKYWKIKNSWDEDWSDNGHFKNMVLFEHPTRAFTI